MCICYEHGIYMFVVYVHVLMYSCVHTHRLDGGHLVCCPIILCLITLKQGLSLNLELGLWPENPSNLSVSISPNVGVIGVCPCLDFYVSSGNLTSGVSSFSNKHSYLLSHLLSPGADI